MFRRAKDRTSSLEHLSSLVLPYDTANAYYAAITPDSFLLLGSWASRFSLINGSFDGFAAAKASPQKASIIKAALQVGFGQYHRCKAVHITALPYNTPIADTMSTAFSQTGMGAGFWSFRSR